MSQDHKVANGPKHANLRIIKRNQSSFKWKEFVNTISMDNVLMETSAKKSTQLSNS